MFSFIICNASVHQQFGLFALSGSLWISAVSVHYEKWCLLFWFAHLYLSWCSVFTGQSEMIRAVTFSAVLVLCPGTNNGSLWNSRNLILMLLCVSEKSNCFCSYSWWLSPDWLFLKKQIIFKPEEFMFAFSEAKLQWVG